MKRLLGFAGGGLVLFALITVPHDSASWVKDIGGGLSYAAQAIISFAHELIPS
jgi:hypothetical protein